MVEVGGSGEIGKLMLKFTWQSKVTSTAKTIVKKNNIVGFPTPPDLKTCSKTTMSSQDGVIWVKDKHIDQWNRMDSQKIDLHINGFVTKILKAIQWRKDVLPSTNEAGITNWTPIDKK